MPRIFRIVAIIGAAILLAALLGVVALWFAGGRQLDKVYALAAEPITVPSDSASLADGERLATVLGCNDCHGANLAGKPFIDALPFAYLPASNLTAGEGGVGASYDAAQMEHAIRHGVDRNGRALMIMPSAEYHHLTDEDVGKVIAFVQGAAPVSNVLQPRQVGFIGRVISALAPAGLFPAAGIDHDAPHPSSIVRAVTPAFGEYLAMTCTGCHGSDYAGGRVPGAGPDAPAASNLTPDDATGLGGWTQEDFVRAMREGITPDGRVLDTSMPWRAFEVFTEEELAAMWLYLRSLPPVEDGSR